MNRTNIGWTQYTWNPISGCTKISKGCDNCYAEKMAKRLQAMGAKGYENGFEVTMHPKRLEAPMSIKKPSLIFVNSMSDIFHKDVPDSFIYELFEVMNRAHWHTFQILTKRSERLVKIDSDVRWSDNIWMGVTIESNDYVDRADYLRECGAKTKFLSLEPLLDDMRGLDYKALDWVIVGGESGAGVRVMKKEWVEGIKDKCSENGVAFFFKQWGSASEENTTDMLDGELYKEFPENNVMSKAVM